MKHFLRTKWIQFAVAIIASTAVWKINAFEYKAGNLLLVLRQEGFKDAEFNLGSVSNFLGKADGTVMQVTNWDLQLALDTYFGSLDGASFLLMAATGEDDNLWRCWLTDGESSGVPTYISGSAMSILRSKIDFVGQQAQASTATNSTPNYTPDSSDVSSYTYIATEGHLDVATLGGASNFGVENTIPSTNRFFELRISNAQNKPAAKLIGAFSLDLDGVLKFTAGSLPPPQSHIESIARAGDQTTISFSTTSGANYRLLYTTDLNSGKVGTWTVLPGTVPGNGSIQTLSDTTTDSQRFYAVETLQ